MKKPTNFTLSLVDPIAASLVLKHERNFPANARDEILARTEDNHDFDFIADPRDLVDRIFRRNGRVGTYYGESWDEILAYNAKQVAAGTPSNCVAFEDSAGTIPLLAPLGSGKGCGLLKDRSGGGNHRIQASATARGEMSRRVNFLDKTEELSDAVWTKVRCTYASGFLTYEESYFNAYQTVSGLIAGKTYTFSVVVGKGVNTNNVTIYNDSSTGYKSANLNLNTGAISGSNYDKPLNVSEVSSGKWRVSGEVISGGGSAVVVYVQTTDTGQIGDSFYLNQADFRLSADANIGKTYQRVTSASDYDEEGFPARWNLKTDDWAKSSINPAGANRAFVLTALRVNSSASLGVLAEYGPTAASTDGTFSLESLSSEITLRVRGASAGTTVSASVANSAYVVVGALIDLASPRQELFINGVSAGVSTAAIGSTTFAERDLFVGARNGTSAFADAGYTAPLMAVFMQPGDPGISAAAIRNLTKLFSKGIRL